MIDSLGLYYNNFNLWNSSGTNLGPVQHFAEIPPFNAALVLLALVVTEFAVFMIWPQAPY